MATPSFIISHALAALKRQMGSVGAQLPWLPEQTDLLCSAPIHFQESNLKNTTAFQTTHTQPAQKDGHSHQPGWAMHQTKLTVEPVVLQNH